jgi:hypothetical protein
MKLTSTVAKRAIAAFAIASTAVLVPAVAMAASGSVAAPQTTVASRCLAGQLTAWVGVPGNGTAGSTYFELEISNVSRSTCTLYGYPGVSALRGSTQLGRAAGRDPSHHDTLVTLGPGATSHVILQITDVGVYSPATCRPEQATSLRVYAPGAYNSIRVPFSFEGCSRGGPVYLHVSATIGGTGVPGYSF